MNSGKEKLPPGSGGREETFEEKVRRIDRAVIGVLVNILVSIVTTLVLLAKLGI